MSWPFLEQNTHLRALIGFSGAGRRLVDFAILSFCRFRSVVEKLLEGGLVVAARERTRCRGTAPRVFACRGPAPPRGGRLAGASAAATTEATTATAAAAGLVHLGRGVLQARADLIDLELDHGALLALAGLERT